MPKTVTIITAKPSDSSYWTDVWRERELLVFLAWRDLLVRYKQTIVGVTWTVLKPLSVIVVYTFVFGILAQLPSHGVPYTLLVLTGLLPWQLFQTVLIVSSDSLISNSALVKKVYFPRIIIPFSSVIVCVVDHLVSFAIVFFLLAWFQVMPGPQVLLLPAVTLLATACGLGLGLIAAAVNVRYRDVRQLLPILLQIGVFLCPVAYATSLVTGKWAWIYALNPMTGVIDAFRWCILGKSELIFAPSIPIAVVFGITSLVLGVKIFRRLEPNFADEM